MALRTVWSLGWIEGRTLTWDKEKWEVFTLGNKTVREEGK
jgi:hypothetical protein